MGITRNRGYIAFDWRRAAALTFVSALLVAGCLTQGYCQSRSDQDERLKEFLQSYVGSPTLATQEYKTTGYSAAFVDLRDDGTKEAIVYLFRDGWCGTGGCVTLILAPEGASYRIVTKIAATRLPIRVLATKTNGWHDISVWARTNGSEPLYEAILPFDGDTYPISPSVPPAHALKREVPGKIVITSTADDTAMIPEARDLYP
jgi:hypothetical protein